MELNPPSPWFGALKSDMVACLSLVVFLNVVPRPVASVSISWQFVKNANLRLHSTPTESEIQKLRPGNLCFNKHSGGF